MDITISDTVFHCSISRQRRTLSAKFKREAAALRSPIATEVLSACDPDALLDRLVEQRRARKTYRQIADDLGVAVSTAARRLRSSACIAWQSWTRRHWCGATNARLPTPDSRLPTPDSRLPTPDDLQHLGIKKLGRFRQPGHRVTGNRQQNPDCDSWAFVCVVIDVYASRIAFSSLRPDELGTTACGELLQALRYY